jgi:iron complex transport system ATP-binding protein
MNVTPILVAAHVGYRAGSIPLIVDVSLSLSSGRVLAVVGPNGAGKSTLLHLLAGDLQPSEGTIRLDGRPLHSYSPPRLARLRAVVTQHTLIHFAYQVEQVVSMGRYPHVARRDISPAQDRQIVLQALQRTEMEPFRARAYPTLSGGEASRTIMARAMAQATEVLLLDEPTASLDIRHQELVMHTCRELAEHGKAVCVILHDLNLAAAYADEIALLDGGRLAAVGSPFDTLTASRLSVIYGHPIYVTTHPRRNCPLVLADSIW